MMFINISKTIMALCYSNSNTDYFGEMVVISLTYGIEEKGTLTTRPIAIFLSRK